jgi:hypothetical protein
MQVTNLTSVIFQSAHVVIDATNSDGFARLGGVNAPCANDEIRQLGYQTETDSCVLGVPKLLNQVRSMKVLQNPYSAGSHAY